MRLPGPDVIHNTQVIHYQSSRYQLALQEPAADDDSTTRTQVFMGYCSLLQRPSARNKKIGILFRTETKYGKSN
jgi:hypothetical protein